MTDTSKAVEQHILRIDPNAQRQIGSLNAATVNLLRTLSAQLEAANARAERARDDALVDAARIADGYGSCACDVDMRNAIQALRTQPTPIVEPVTVQEAANLILERGYDPKTVIEAMRDAKDFGCGSCDIFDTALRAIAGEKL